MIFTWRDKPTHFEYLLDCCATLDKLLEKSSEGSSLPVNLECGERPRLLEVCCCWECEFFDPCGANSNWGKTLWLGLVGVTERCELFRLEHIMSCNCSRVATNLGAFPPRLARVCKLCLPAFSLPRIWEMGSCCCSTTVLWLSALLERMHSASTASWGTWSRLLVCFLTVGSAVGKGDAGRCEEN